MGRLEKGTFSDFLASIKHAGVAISNEGELRDRLAEAQRWRYAFDTLSKNGKSIGICFADPGARVDLAEVRQAFQEFQFPEKSGQLFEANLKTAY